jgi:hypothetical protein
MEGNYNHTAHSFSIVSPVQNPTTKTQNKTKQEQISFSSLNLRNQLVIKQTKKTTRKPSKSRP